MTSRRPELEQADLFATVEASFRDKLLADQPAVGSDGATWELVKWQHHGWGFSRTAPGEIKLAWVNSGIRGHTDRVEAVDDLERVLVLWGAGWQARDIERRDRSARVAADLFRIRCAVPEGWRWSKRGLYDETIYVDRPYDREEKRQTPTQIIYRTDLYNVPGHADRIIDTMRSWIWPPPPEIEDAAAEPDHIITEPENLI